jgi:8-oxo-dGTP diphosphatase
VANTPGILARGPWDPDHVEASWRTDEFEPQRAVTEAADVALDALRRRGSPSHDGLAARLSDFTAESERLYL